MHLRYPKSWWKGVKDDQLINKWKDYDKKKNKYKVKVGTTLEYWEEKKWITKHNVYGWTHWYCDYYYKYY